jgi:glycosyltransferase involved in cell wall biosynthesis
MCDAGRPWVAVAGGHYATDVPAGAGQIGQSGSGTERLSRISRTKGRSRADFPSVSPRVATIVTAAALQLPRPGQPMTHTSDVKILEITSYPPPRAGWGVRVEHVRHQLEAMGHECQVLNTGKSRHMKSDEFVGVRHGLDYCVKVVKFSLRGFTVHMHVNGDSPKGLALSLLALTINRCFGRRPYLTFHAGPEQQFFPQTRSRLFAPIFATVFRLADSIICNSDVVKAKICGYGVPADKVVPIPAFSRQYLRFQKVPLPPRVEEFLRQRGPVVATYLNFRPEFFVDSLIDAVKMLAARYPNFGLVIMGADGGSQAAVDRIRHMGLDSHVLLTGDLPHDEFMTLMTRARLYLRTPKKDGVCSSVLEALSLKVPVVASENGTRPAGTVTFRPDDAIDLAEKVSYVLEHNDAIRAALVPPPIRDTVLDEATLLAGGAPRRRSRAA